MINPNNNLPKQIANYLFRIETRFFQQNGYFGKYRCGSVMLRRGNYQLRVDVEALFEEGVEPKLCLSYWTDQHTPNAKRHILEVPITTTPCNLGGTRYWFLCPLCAKKAWVLYLHKDFFGCIDCHKLTYETQKLSGIWKIGGKVVSFSEVDRLKQNIKRKAYAGKATKAYMKYVMAKVKSTHGFMAMASTLDAELDLYDAFWAKTGKPRARFGKKGKAR